MPDGFLRSVSEEDIARQTGRIVPGERPIAISLFTGAGGMDIGFSEGGWRTAVMVEYEKHACATLRANWTAAGIADYDRNSSSPRKPEDLAWYHKPEPVIFERDICTVSTQEILDAAKLRVGEAGMVMGGPPCQGFSIIGKRIIDDPRNRLFMEFVRVVREALPYQFFMENVPGILSINQGRSMKEICEEFASCGYEVGWRILNAADYGVPQMRRRVFIRGLRNDALVLKEEERAALHMGATIGPICYPDRWMQKYGRKLYNAVEQKEMLVSEAESKIKWMHPTHAPLNDKRKMVEWENEHLDADKLHYKPCYMGLGEDEEGG